MSKANTTDIDAATGSNGNDDSTEKKITYEEDKKEGAVVAIVNTVHR